MKTILIATDLSENSKHTAAYGYFLARHLKAGILLCHAMNIPVEAPEMGLVAWPPDVYEDIIKDSENELHKLKSLLVAEDKDRGYHPHISSTHKAGFVTDVLNTEASTHQADLIIIGTHGYDSLTTLMIGNHSRNMIEASVSPLLLVPANIAIKPIKKIAFSSDFKQPDKDLEAINSLVSFANAFDAELVLVHINQNKDDSDQDTNVKELLAGLKSKINYKNLSYRVVKSDHVEGGLDWLIRHAHIDVIAMVHRNNNFFNRLFNGSHTQKAAKQVPVPLMVLKDK